MKIFLADQSNRFPYHLERLKKTNVMQYDRAKLTEKVASRNLNNITEIGNLDLSILFQYKIFPSHIMSSLCQWNQENRSMKVGDTIVQQVFIPPVKWFSQKLLFGVRISEIIETETKRGFSYETLDGHVEKGISTFTVEKTREGIIFKVHTFSKPGNLLAWILGPVFSVPYQKYCTNAALMYVKRQFELR